MSQQIADTFIWNDEEWVFLDAENIYSLFDPEEYGLHQKETSGSYIGL